MPKDERGLALSPEAEKVRQWLEEQPRRKNEWGESLPYELTAEEWGWTERLIRERGEQWVIDNWPRLERQLKYIRTL